MHSVTFWKTCARGSDAHCREPIELQGGHGGPDTTISTRSHDRTSMSNRFPKRVPIPTPGLPRPMGPCVARSPGNNFESTSQAYVISKSCQSSARRPTPKASNPMQGKAIFNLRRSGGNPPIKCFHGACGNPAVSCGSSPWAQADHTMARACVAYRPWRNKKAERIIAEP